MELHAGGWQQTWLNQADLIVANPGIALASEPLQQAMAGGVPVVGDIELFAWAADKPVVAVTGSNGKSTVTDLTGVLANAAGVKTVIGGNIGVPALDLLNEPADLYVLELSSFQLETTSNLSLAAAAFLNLSEDHMDRYQGMEDYRQAKLRIFHHAQAKIVNHDDKQTYPDQAITGISTFGVTDGDYHLLEHQGQTWLARHQTPLLSTEQVALVGQHNMLNILASFALLEAVNIDVSLAFDALSHYSGLSHRCQVVSRHDGVTWVNDSKATNVASTLAALTGLELSGRLYLLVGGDGKGADFDELAPVLSKLNVELCCFGADGRLFLPLAECSLYHETLGQSVDYIRQQVKAGDMVMLSPACASFDQFANFMQRGEVFTALARQK